MMGRRCLIMVMVFVMSLFVLMPSTWAKDGEDPDAAWTTGVSRGLAYEQEDLKGTWTTKVWAGSVEGKQCWVICTIEIGRRGDLQPGARCMPCIGKEETINGGKLTISADGMIQGTIETNRGTWYIERGGIVDEELILGTANTMDILPQEVGF